MTTKLFFVVLAGFAFAVQAREELFFVGSGRANIEAYRLDDATGTATSLGTAAEIEAPSFLAISPNKKFLYAVSEGRTADSSSVSGFSIDPKNGKLAAINTQPSKGAGPCFVEVDRTGKDVLVANYNNGSSAVLPIDHRGALEAASAVEQDSGSSVNPQRQAGPHAHCIVTDPNDRFAYVCDLGMDKVMIFHFHPKQGTLEPAEPPFASVAPGSGPRHIAFHPSAKWAYVINEMKSTVAAFSHNSDNGSLTQFATYPLLPSDYSSDNTGAEIVVNRAGTFVYCSNRGDNSIVLFACDPATGRLSYITRFYCGGRTPRQFTIDPSGQFLLVGNQDSNLVSIFAIDKESGRLKDTGNSIQTDTPECIVFH